MVSVFLRSMFKALAAACLVGTCFGQLQIAKLLPDPTRPRVYAINQNPGGNGSILVLDSLSHSTIASITVGQEPTDMDLTEDAGDLLVMNTSDASIMRIDLDSLEVSDTYPLGAFSNRNQDFGGHVADGPGDIIYYVDEQWGPRLRVFDTSTSTVLQTFGATSTGTGNDNGFGDIVISPDQSTLFGWVQYGDGAGWSGSYVVRYDIAADGRLTFSGQGDGNWPTTLRRDPLGTPALMTADGSALFVKSRTIDQSSLIPAPGGFPGDIYSITPGGEIAFTSSAGYPGNGGASVLELDGTFTVQAVTPDYASLVYFDPTTGALRWIDLLDRLGPEQLGLELHPPDGGAVAQPTEFRWPPVAGIRRYLVFLGTDRSAVETAGQGDPEFLGETTATSFPLTSPLAQNQTYYWRIVPVLADGSTGTAVTRSFFVSTLTLSRTSIEVETVVGVTNHRESIGIDSPAPLSWTASADAAWITFETNSGSSPGTATVFIDASQLTPGLHSSSINITSDGVTIPLPVEVRVHEANYTLAEADLDLPRIYAISQLSDNGSDPAFLITINSTSGEIETAKRVGTSATDLAVHYFENRIYVTNWRTGSLIALDRDALEEVQTYQYNPAGGYGTNSGDVYRVAAGTAGRAIIEQEDQWIYFKLIDTTDGSVLDTFYTREGGGRFEPSGRYYYHGENGTTGAGLVKVDTNGDSLTEVAAGDVSGVSYYGSRRVVLSGDGSRVCWNGGIFDRDLGLLLVLDQEVIASTLHGDAVTTASAIHNGTNGLRLADLPVSTSVQAVSGDQKTLFLFDGSSVQTVDLETVLELPGRELTPGIADGTTVAGTDQSLSWTQEPFATSYDVYFGSDRDAVANATSGSAEHLGVVSGTSWPDPLSGLDLDGEYFWRIDINGVNGTRTGAVWSFSIAPIDHTPRDVVISYPVGTPIPTQSLTFDAPAPASWTASADSPWILLAATSGTTSDTLEFDFDPGTLTAGTHHGAITLQSGGAEWQVPVTLELLTLNYTLAKADLERNLIYAISQESESGNSPAHLVVIDTTSDSVLLTQPVGSSVTDLEVHYQENRIYITNWKLGILRALDRNSFEEVATYEFEPFASVYTNNDIYRVAAGKQGRIVFEPQDQWINLGIYDTTNRTTLNFVNVREGGGAFGPLGRYYFHGENNSSAAALIKFDTDGDVFTRLAGERVTGFNYYGSRRVVIAGDGTRIYWNGGIFDQNLKVLQILNNEVVSATLHGELAITDRQIHDGSNGLLLGALPVTTSVQAVSADQGKLFLFSGGGFQTVALRDFADLPPRGLTPGIADGSTVFGTDQVLSWSPEPFATSYDIYFGTDRNSVANATPGSELHLGNAGGTSWTGSPPPLALGGEYFWRVDINGFSGPTTGPVWSFKVAPILISPPGFNLTFPSGTPIPDQILTLAAPAASQWTATTASPWIKLGTTPGTTDGTLALGLDSTSLSEGLHEGSVTFTSGTDTWDVPVSLELIPLNITELKPDPGRPDVLYAINYANPDTHLCYLLRIDANTALITDSTPIGRGATDFDIDATTDRLYVANEGFPETQVVDLASFTTLAPLMLGTNIGRIEADGRGHLYSMASGRNGITIWDISTGKSSSLGSSSFYRGDIEISPDGNHLFHAPVYPSSHIIHKISLTDSPGTVEASLDFSPTSASLLRLSTDGSQAVFGLQVVDDGLRSTAYLPANGICVSPGGELVAGTGTMWWADGGGEVATLPFTATIANFSSDGRNLIAVDASTGGLHGLRVSDFVEFPGPSPKPGQILSSSPEIFSWNPVNGAASYHLTVDGGPAGSLVFEGITGTSFTLPATLPGGHLYTWRVDAITPGGITSGSPITFGIAFPEAPTAIDIGVNATLAAVSLGNRSLVVGPSNGTALLQSFDPATGASSLVQTFNGQDPYYSYGFGTAVAADDSMSVVGSPGYSASGVSSSGAFYTIAPNDRGYLERSDPIFALPAVSNQSFGSSMSADGHLLMIGGRGAPSGSPGRALAFLTYPSLQQTQIVRPLDSKNGDGFGNAVAIRGNTALISADGRGPTYSWVPTAYVFSRDTATGQWSQDQKLDLPGILYYHTAGNVLALGDDILAIENSYSGSAYVFVRKGGVWSHSTTLKKSDVPGASSGFASSLAVEGDTVFVGDPNATVQGTTGGAVFSFHRDGDTWTRGLTMSPRDPVRNGFGSSLSSRNGWLLVGGYRRGWMFRISDGGNHDPLFETEPPTQAVSGRLFEATVEAHDPDGDQGLAIELLEHPAWLSLDDHGDGTATFLGTPDAPSGSTSDIQLRVSDPAGGQAFQAFRLTLLSPDDIPVITRQPAGAHLSVGRELALKGDAEGIGPFQWQWQRDGEDIPGANSPFFTIPEASLEDAGTYTFTVTNIVASVTSAPAVVTVRPADRFAGPWETFGGGSSHTGKHPATLGRHVFVEAWHAPIKDSFKLNRPAIANGRVFVNYDGHFLSGDLRALDLTTGSTLWTHPIPYSFSVNPPTWHDGRVYFQRGKGTSDPTGPQLFCLDASTGEEIWTAKFGAQWETYEAPTVDDSGIWINGGTYGGMYGFTHDGAQMFFHDLPQYDEWTPTASGGRLFSWVEGEFIEHDPRGGRRIWSVDVGWNWQGWSMQTVSAVSSDRAIVISTTGIYAISLSERRILWNVEGDFTGSPAIADGRVHAFLRNSVVTYDLESGALQATRPLPFNPASKQPLATNDHLIVAGSSETLVYRIDELEPAQQLPVGGYLAYSDGYLLVAANNGFLHAYFANAAPKFTTQLQPTIEVPDSAPDFELPLGDSLEPSDPGDTLSWQIVNVSRPEIFRTLEIDPGTGDLTVIYNPWEWGSSEVTVSVGDSAGNVTETILTFTVPDLPLPALQLAENLVLNRQTGLYEHTITITNPGAREIAGFDLTITGLPESVAVNNASGKEGDAWIVQHRQPMAAGASVTLVLEYYAPVRGTVIDPDVAVTLVTEPESDAAAELPGFAIDRCEMLPDGLLIEFTSVPGILYEIQYSDDATSWKVSPTLIRAAGNRTQWIDRGPPRTDSAPSSKASRFYRVAEIAESPTE